jgi:hypothetical protein
LKFEILEKYKISRESLVGSRLTFLKIREYRVESIEYRVESKE